MPIGSNRVVKIVVPKGRINKTMVFTPTPVADINTKQNFENIERKLSDLTKKTSTGG